MNAPILKDHKPAGVAGSSGQTTEKKPRSVKKIFSDYISSTDDKGRDAIAKSAITKKTSDESHKSHKKITFDPHALEKKEKKDKKTKKVSHLSSRKTETPKKDAKPISAKPAGAAADAIPPPAAAAPFEIKPPVSATQPEIKPPAAAVPSEAKPPAAAGVPSNKKKKKDSDTEVSSSSEVSAAMPPLPPSETELKRQKEKLTRQKIEVLFFEQEQDLEEIYHFLNQKKAPYGQYRHDRLYFPTLNAEKKLVWTQCSQEEEIQELHQKTLIQIMHRLNGAYERGCQDFLVIKTKEVKTVNELRVMLLDNPSTRNTFEKPPKPRRKAPTHVIETASEVARVWNKNLILFFFHESILLNRLSKDINGILEILNQQEGNQAELQKVQELIQYFDTSIELCEINQNLYTTTFLMGSHTQEELPRALTIGKRQGEWNEAKQKFRSNLMELILQILKLPKIKEHPKFVDFPNLLEYQKNKPMGISPLKVMVAQLAKIVIPPRIPRLPSVQPSLTKKNSSEN